MVYKLINSEYGPYKDNSGARYEIFEATKVATPQGINVGWIQCESMEAMAQLNNLTYDSMTEADINDAITLQNILDEEVNK